MLGIEQSLELSKDLAEEMCRKIGIATICAAKGSMENIAVMMFVYYLQNLEWPLSIEPHICK